jgi:hypothetical protein
MHKPIYQECIETTNAYAYNSCDIYHLQNVRDHRTSKYEQRRSLETEPGSSTSVFRKNSRASGVLVGGHARSSRRRGPIGHETRASSHSRFRSRSTRRRRSSWSSLSNSTRKLVRAIHHRRRNKRNFRATQNCGLGRRHIHVASGHRNRARHFALRGVVVALKAHRHALRAHLRLVMRGGDDGVVEARAPAAIGRVDTSWACDVHLGGGGRNFLYGGDGINALGVSWWMLAGINCGGERRATYHRDRRGSRIAQCRRPGRRWRGGR